MAAGVVALAVLAYGQATPSRSAPLLTSPATAGPSAQPVTRTAAPADAGVGWWTFVAAPTQLLLPSDVSGARLSAIPDSLLNDPPAARFRMRVLVRGTVGLGASDGPAVIAWSEDGFWYELSSTRLTIPQLIDLASALR